MTASRAVLGKIGTDENHFIKAKAGSTTNKQVSRNKPKNKTKHKTIFFLIPFFFSPSHFLFFVYCIILNSCLAPGQQAIIAPAGVAYLQNVNREKERGGGKKEGAFKNHCPLRFLLWPHKT